MLFTLHLIIWTSFWDASAYAASTHIFAICIQQIQKRVQWRISQYNLWQNASTTDFNNLAKLQKQVQQAGRQAAVKVL